MNRKALATLLLLVGVGVGQKRPAHPKPDTPRLDFVNEYVRELISDEDIKKAGLKEVGGAKTIEEQFSTDIYFSRSVQLELRSQVRVLKGMRLSKPFDTLIPNLIGFYQHEIELHQNLIDLCTKFMGGPKPGVDYSALAAKMPQIRAELEQTQKAVFEATPLIFMALIDQKPDSQDHVSHLLITKAEKSDLQAQLGIMLKNVPDEGDQDYYISAAMVLRAGLQKGHKCSDDPWE